MDEYIEEGGCKDYIMWNDYQTLTDVCGRLCD
jgi:hypothetical protein